MSRINEFYWSLKFTRVLSRSDSFAKFFHTSSCQCKKYHRYIYILILILISLNIHNLQVCLILFSFLSIINDRHSNKMATNKSNSITGAIHETADCIYERLRTQVNRIGSAGGSTSHIFFIFGASVRLIYRKRINFCLFFPG